MPKEDRRLIFSYSEVYKAVYALCVQREMKKPFPGHITNITQNPDDDSQFILYIENNQENETREIEYRRDFLAAALMLFCRSLGIPLPRRANKAVIVKDNTVILRILI